MEARTWLADTEGFWHSDYPYSSKRIWKLQSSQQPFSQQYPTAVFSDEAPITLVRSDEEIIRSRLQDIGGQLKVEMFFAGMPSSRWENKI